MKLFEHGAEYWLFFQDGSKVRVSAHKAADGEIDLKNEAIEFSLWASWKNLDGIEVQRIN